jgi:hypothetical protein
VTAPPTREQLRSRRKHPLRKKTENLQRMSGTERHRLTLLVPQLTAEELAMRPRTRGDCENGLRPCPWVGCRHHLYLDVAKTGNLTLHFPDLEVEQLVETCSLDIAEHGGETLEFCGEVATVTRERIRQLEVRALLRIKRRGREALRDFLPEGKLEPVRALGDDE